MTNCNSKNGRCPTLNRKSFMAELRSLLAFLDAAERERVLNRYERMFDEAGAEGEAAVIRCFGSPVRQVLQIEREYREAVASGETPFADGDAAVTEESEAPEEAGIVEEEYTETEIGFDEAEPETEEPLPEEAGEEPEPLPEEPAAIAPEVPAAAAPESPAYAVLPELDLDDLDFSDLGLTFPKKTEIPEDPAEPEAPEVPAESDEPAEPENTPETLPQSEEDEPAKPAAEEAATEPEESAPADEMPKAEPETAETADPEAVEASETPEEPEEPETLDETALTYDIPAEELPAEETETAPEMTPAEEPAEEEKTEEEYEYEEAEERRPVSGGRVFAAVVVTIPMLAVWALLFGLSLGLGVAVLAIGAALVAVGVYLTGYVFNGAIVRMPDLLLTAGAALAVFALALLLLWTGVSIAVAGCTLTVRLTRSIYRSILYPKKEENGDE